MLTKDQIDEFVDTSCKGLNLTPQQIELKKEVARKIAFEGMTIAEAAGFDQNFLDVAYTCAYTLYQKGKFADAGFMFKWLKQVDPAVTKYYIAEYHCFVQQKKWKEALTPLMELFIIDPTDPYPFVKMSNCYLEQKINFAALVMLEQAITIAGNRSAFAKEKVRWQMEYDQLLSTLELDPVAYEKTKEEMSQLLNKKK